MSTPDGSDYFAYSDEQASRRPNPIDAHVGGRVRLRRMLLGVSQEKLGEQLGLSFQQIQKYEKGMNRIGASRLYELSRILNVPVQFFYDDVPTQKSGSEALPGFAESSDEPYFSGVQNSRESVDLNKAFARIADLRTRRAIIDLVRSLAASDALLEAPASESA